MSRSVSAGIISKLKAGGGELRITYRDLSEAPLAHLSSAYLGAVQDPHGDHTPEILADLASSSAALEEFVDADTVVIGVPLYNFTVPTQLKAWIDRILVAGKTFRYGTDGRPEGLMGGKRVIVGIARGSVYGPGSPIASLEHGETYLRVAFEFIGIRNLEVVAADGVAAGSEQRQHALDSVERQIASLAA